MNSDWEFEFLGMANVPTIVGFTGPTKTGKTVIARRLAAQHGFYYIGLGNMLGKLAQDLGYENIDWKDLGEVGESLRILKGKDVLAKMAFEKIKTNYKIYNKIVIDSLLHPEEIKYFQSRVELHLIGVDMPFGVRCKQYRRWTEVGESHIKKMIAARDKYEQYSIQNGNEYSPNVQSCLNLIENPEKNLIKLNKPLSVDTVNLDVVEEIVKSTEKRLSY